MGFNPEIADTLNLKPLPQDGSETTSPDYILEIAQILLPDLLWVVLILILVAWFYPKFHRDILPRMTSLKAFGIEAEFAKETIAAAAKVHKISLTGKEMERVSRRVGQFGKIFLGANILWVDDNPKNNEFEDELLHRLGANVTFSMNNSDALKLTSRHRFDLVLTDIGRPDGQKTGLDFASDLFKQSNKEGFSFPTVIAYTGEDQTGKARPEYLFGITNRPDELVDLIMDALHRARG